MFKKKHSFVALAVFFAFAPLFSVMGQKNPKRFPELSHEYDRFYMAYPVENAPVIDGKLEKEFWGKLPKAKYFVVDDQKTDSVTRQTVFYIAYDAKYLYLGAKMFEPFTHLLHVKKNVLNRADRINFIFSKVYNRKGSYNDSPYIFLLCDINAPFQAFRNTLPSKKTVPLKVTPDWKIAYSKDALHWYMEARVPFASLGFSPKDEEVFFNVRRDLAVGPATEQSSMWNKRVHAGLGAHSFATLIFNKKAGNADHDTFRLNARPRYWYHRTHLIPIGQKKGAYQKAYLQYGKEKNWKAVEKAAEKMNAFFEKNRKKGIRAFISDEWDDYYMEFLQAVANVQRAAVPRQLQIPVKDAVITSVTLNGKKIVPKNGKYLLTMEPGMSKLEIRANARGKNPGIRIVLSGSPETAENFSAFTAKNKQVPLKKNNGYLWAGNEKSLIFRQTLIWNREYCNHDYTFIFPNVRKWGVSPGETMHFIHRVYDVNKSGRKTPYTLVMEIPEGFKRISDWGNVSIFNHYPTRKIKEEKITLNGEKYLRYTYNWTLPAKLDRGLANYIHYISVKHDSYKFAKGKKPVVRFRRIINGNTTDIVNTIPLHELPPIRGGKMKKILFPQYHNFCGGYVSDAQMEVLVKDSVAAGLDCFWYRIANKVQIQQKTRIHRINRIQKKYASRNMVWMANNIPLHGAGAMEGHTRQLVKSTPDLQAVFFDDSKWALADFAMPFCMTKATGKYRKAFYEALRKDYKMVTELTGTREIFINDEAQHKRSKSSWRYSHCFCQDCKNAFFRFAKIKPRPITNKELVSQYENEWEKFWKYSNKNKLLSLAYSAAKSLGCNVSYYHTSSDHISVKYAKGFYDHLYVTIPGCATFTGSNFQSVMDHSLKKVREMTGQKNLTGQFRTYVPSESYSSDGVYFYPEETKLQLLRLAASLQRGAICECASFFSAGAFYYAGLATKIIADHEDIFYNGTRRDYLAAGTFKYPDALVLVKGKERLVLLFNEDDVPKKGELINRNLPKGAKAQIYGQKNWISNPAKMNITIPAKDAVVIHIK